MASQTGSDNASEPDAPAALWVLSANLPQLRQHLAEVSGDHTAATAGLFTEQLQDLATKGASFVSAGAGRSDFFLCFARGCDPHYHTATALVCDPEVASSRIKVRPLEEPGPGWTSIGDVFKVSTNLNTAWTAHSEDDICLLTRKQAIENNRTLCWDWSDGTGYRRAAHFRRLDLSYRLDNLGRRAMVEVLRTYVDELCDDSELTEELGATD